MPVLSNGAAAALKQLIADRGLAGQPWDIAAALSQPETVATDETAPVPRRAIKSTLLKRQRLMAILDSAEPAARAAAYVLSDQDFAEIDLSDLAAQGIVQELAGLKLLDGEDVAALMELGKVQRRISPAQQALGMDVDQGMVAQALGVI